MSVYHIESITSCRQPLKAISCVRHCEHNNTPVDSREFFSEKTKLQPQKNLNLSAVNYIKMTFNRQH